MPGYISEYDHYGNSPEFIELAIPKGTDVSGYSVVIYGSDGYLDHTILLSKLTVQTTISGYDVYIIQSGTPGFFGIDSGDSTALIDDTGTVLQFITHTRAVKALNGPAAGEASTYIGTANGTGSSLQSDDGGATYYVQSATNPGVIPCYAPGTLIETPDGAVRVEDLKAGDPVATLDSGPKAILWVRHVTQPLEDLAPDAMPVLIPAGALGPGRPAQDLIVSPQHRILAGGGDQLTEHFAREVLVPAKALTVLPRIRFMNGKRAITWIHFAFDSHEIVIAGGCLSESLLLGPLVLTGLHQVERRDLAGLICGRRAAEPALNGPAARRCLSVSETRRRLAATKCGQTAGRATGPDERVVWSGADRSLQCRGPRAGIRAETTAGQSALGS